MILGMTGSRFGLSSQQHAIVTTLLDGERVDWPRPYQLHHGDCVGADERTHYIAIQLTGILTVSHPPIDSKWRAYCNAHVIMPPRPYHDRNHDIVTVVERMFALPSGEEQSQPRSGTWSTIRYAIRNHRPILIIYPDGREELK
jgi:hypothetical protein